MAGSMKVHSQLASAVTWENEPSPTLGLKRSHNNSHSLSSLDLNFFIKPDSGPRKPPSPRHHHQAHSTSKEGVGMRWSPTPEQIGILEMLFTSGMRTPNTEQIRQISAQLGKYGKIEGKNVFYWFQNHKARERQKLKRKPSTSSSSATAFPFTLPTKSQVEEGEEDRPLRRRCRSLAFDCFQLEEITLLRREEKEYKTLELFPLHPEGR